MPQRGIWGTAGIGGLNIDPAIDNQGAILEVVSVPERLDDVIQQDAALLKASDVLSSALPPLPVPQDSVLIRSKELRAPFLPFGKSAEMPNFRGLQVDVEGFEPDVFETAARLLSERKFDHIFMEYSPGAMMRQPRRHPIRPVYPRGGGGGGGV